MRSELADFFHRPQTFGTVTTMDDDYFMTLEEVARLLRMSVQTVYGWRSKGSGPKASKIGRHLRYRRSDVEKWIEDQAR